MFDDTLRALSPIDTRKSEELLLETIQQLDLLAEGSPGITEPLILEKQELRWHEIARKREEGIPLERILGMVTFMGLLLFCSPDVLCPRKETELLVRTALGFMVECEVDPTVVDVGTGCGNIAVSLAMNAGRANILATDISPAAIEVARQNVAQYGLEDRVSLFCGDLFAPLRGSRYEGAVDLVVSNPPYIPTNSLKRLPAEVLNYEPRIALDAGPYGIRFFRRLIADSASILKPGGVLVFEIGEGQDKLVTRMLERNGSYEAIGHHRYGEHVRVVSVVKSWRHRKAGRSNRAARRGPSKRTPAVQAGASQQTRR